MSERKDNEAGINISYYDPRFWKARIRGLVEDRIHSGGSHCVLLYLIPFEKDASDSLIFWSNHVSIIGERKKTKFLGWPAELDALARRLSPKAIVVLNFFCFSHFWTYE